MDAVEVRAACHAMGTRFELVLWGDSENHLRAAAAEATDEILRIHRQLSAFDPSSDVAEINRRAAYEAVRVDPRLIVLVERCRTLWRLTHGAFDIALGALMEELGFRSAPARQPSAPTDAAAAWGMEAVVTDPATNTVRFTRPGVALDFGAVGKGYALEEVGVILKESRVCGALVHGGTSSVLAVGKTKDGHPWRVAVRDRGTAEDRLDVVEMENCALGVSAVYGRTAQCDGRQIAHVLDPRTGQPASGHTLAAVCGPSATEADALSTALLVLGESFAAELKALGYRYWLR